MPSVDAISHVRGTSQYVDDALPPSGLLQAAVVASPLAHGTLRSLDLQAARAQAGVVAVFTAADIPGQNCWGTIIADQPLLAATDVQYVGQPLAVVVGQSRAIAQAAAQQVQVMIDPLPPLLDPREAYRRGQIIGQPRSFALGDVEQAWADCDTIVEGSCDLGGQEHLYLETQRCRAIPLEGRGLRLESATQNPYGTQRTVAQMLGLACHDVEVEVKRLGGGFGGKEEQATLWAALAALAAWQLQQPVELVLSRPDDLRMTGKRHPYLSEFKLGLTRAGKMLAYEVKHYQNAGAYADLSPAVLERTLCHSTNAYAIPNVRITAVSCRTNLPPSTALRGFGGPQGMFVIESAIAQAAEQLGVPKEELQANNLLRAGDTLPYGQRLSTDSVRQTWEQVCQTYHFARRRKAVAIYNASQFERKKGLALMPICFGISFSQTFLNQAGALVHVYGDGSVSVSTGGVEMGQGLRPKIAQIAARAFGIDEQQIKIEGTNTTRVANMSPSAASVTTDLNGHATLAAIAQILARLRALAAQELGGLDPNQVAIAQEQVLYANEPTGWSWQQLVAKAALSRVDLSAHGFYATPGLEFDRQRERGHPFAYHVCGTALIEVTLDCLRGTYEIDAVRLVHDLGRSVQPQVDRGQVEGGLVQGLGWMTIEDLRFNEKGQLLSKDLSTYKIPDVFFGPQTLEIQFIETPEKVSGPYSSKAVGEPPLIYGLGVFFALREAMQAFRQRPDYAFKLPLTPEQVLCELYREAVERLTIPEGLDHGQTTVESVPGAHSSPASLPQR
jgi:xanthine dehydrogenase large subunit